MNLRALSVWRYKGFALHFILWSGLLLLNYIIFGMPGIEFDFSFSLGTWAIYVLLFYLNYSLLIPRFLFNKRYPLYIFLLIVTLGVNSYFKRSIDNYFFGQQILKGNIVFNMEPPKNKDFFQPKGVERMPPSKMEPMRPKMKWGIGNDRFFFPGLSQLLLIVLASISLRFVKKWQDDEKLKAEIEKEKISTELLFLKQQINPHFLFNAINSIYSLSISKMPNTSDAIIKLSSILRYMLYETDKKYVSLTNEIEVINDYIELQRLRITEKVKLQFVVKGNVSEYQIVPLIMLPLIENAFKHGVDNANDSFIGIMIEVELGDLNLTIINRIVHQTKSLESSGIGIKNIIRRLDLLYPNAYFLDSVAEGDVFKVNLKIKLQQ